MRFSYISALLLAPLALAHPIASSAPSSDAISINQRDGSAPVDARALSISQKINKIADEGHKVTEMCQKYQGGVLESIYLYRQFKNCKSSVESAEKAAKQSGPLSEGESKKVEVALERLTLEFVQISKALQERVSISFSLFTIFHRSHGALCCDEYLNAVLMNKTEKYDYRYTIPILLSIGT
ncbi:hypothetical protein OCU04_006416 [Sclerotinia nivalis]|uniref:Uncharacterized protein n=1 Tax=Sclerotinia nivalis TaxID=352851 RepID=A0A9X0DJC5_9HELO|nr:hypothetical protein OCU04_006416 [Sclerotinia nivalis]